MAVVRPERTRTPFESPNLISAADSVRTVSNPLDMFASVSQGATFISSKGKAFRLFSDDAEERLDAPFSTPLTRDAIDPAFDAVLPSPSWTQPSSPRHETAKNTKNATAVVSEKPPLLPISEAIRRTRAVQGGGTLLPVEKSQVVLNELSNTVAVRSKNAIQERQIQRQTAKSVNRPDRPKATTIPFCQTAEKTPFIAPLSDKTSLPPVLRNTLPPSFARTETKGVPIQLVDAKHRSQKDAAPRNAVLGPLAKTVAVQGKPLFEEDDVQNVAAIVETVSVPAVNFSVETFTPNTTSLHFGSHDSRNDSPQKTISLSELHVTVPMPPSPPSAPVVASIAASESVSCPSYEAPFAWPELCTTICEKAPQQIETLVDQLEAEYGHGRRSFAFHGYDAGDGCSTLLLCAANELVQRGLRVVIVDATAPLVLIPNPSSLQPLNVDFAAESDHFSDHYILVDGGSICGTDTPSLISLWRKHSAQVALIVINTKEQQTVSLQSFEQLIDDEKMTFLGIAENNFAKDAGPVL